MTDEKDPLNVILTEAQQARFEKLVQPLFALPGGYAIPVWKERTAMSGLPYKCPWCAAESWNPNDAANRYCGRCHVFEDDEKRMMMTTAEGFAFVATKEAVAAFGAVVRALRPLDAAERERLLEAVRGYFTR